MWLLKSQGFPPLTEGNITLQLTYQRNFGEYDTKENISGNTQAIWLTWEHKCGAFHHEILKHNVMLNLQDGVLYSHKFLQIGKESALLYKAKISSPACLFHFVLQVARKATTSYMWLHIMFRLSLLSNVNRNVFFNLHQTPFEGFRLKFPCTSKVLPFSILLHKTSIPPKVFILLW